MDDYISRQAAIDALDVLCQEHRYKIPGKAETYSQYNEAWQDALARAEGAIGNLLPAQPEIIYCKDCAKHNKGVGDLEVLPDGRNSWIWKDQACPLVNWRGKAQGHEFDYQYCVFAERRTNE